MRLLRLTETANMGSSVLVVIGLTLTFSISLVKTVGAQALYDQSSVGHIQTEGYQNFVNRLAPDPNQARDLQKSRSTRSLQAQDRGLHKNGATEHPPLPHPLMLSGEVKGIQTDRHEDVSPRQAVSEDVSPRQAVSEDVSHRQAASEDVSHRQAASRNRQAAPGAARSAGAHAPSSQAREIKSEQQAWIDPPLPLLPVSLVEDWMEREQNTDTGMTQGRQLSFVRQSAGQAQGAPQEASTPGEEDDTQGPQQGLVEQGSEHRNLAAVWLFHQLLARGPDSSRSLVWRQQPDSNRKYKRHSLSNGPRTYHKSSPGALKEAQASTPPGKYVSSLSQTPRESQAPILSHQHYSHPNRIEAKSRSLGKYIYKRPFSPPTDTETLEKWNMERLRKCMQMTEVTNCKSSCPSADQLLEDIVLCFLGTNAHPAVDRSDDEGDEFEDLEYKRFAMGASAPLETENNGHWWWRGD